MSGRSSDPIRVFYEAHPYPPPPPDLDGVVDHLDESRRRVEHHLVWPRLSYRNDYSILVAGCGTSQAVRYAARLPGADVVGIDVSTASLDHTRRLAARYGLTNLDLHELPIEKVGDLGREFDQIVCTGVLHHLADPDAGLAALRSATAPQGALTLMVYGRYGRLGISLLREYCELLGVSPTPLELDDLVATIREIPRTHPVRPLLQSSADFHNNDAIVDALLNPRERAYSVPELLDLVTRSGFRFGRWLRQAPYLPDCGAIAETPHSARLLELPAAEQYAAVELFRGTLARHTVIAYRDDQPGDERLDFSLPEAQHHVPLRVPTAISVEERLPEGAAAALLNRAHSSTDLVMFIDTEQRAIFDRIDGAQTVAELGPDAARFCRRLWRHDLIAIDASHGEP